MPKYKLIPLILALAITSLAHAQPLRESLDRNDTASDSATNTSTSTIGVPAAMSLALRKLMPFDMAAYDATYIYTPDALDNYQPMHQDLIKTAGGYAEYRQSRLATLTKAGTPLAKQLAAIIKACTTTECVNDFAYKDKHVGLGIPAAFVGHPD